MRILLSVALVLLAASCERPDEHSAPPPEPPGDPARLPAPEPEPFDTAGVIEEARMMARQAEADVDVLTRLERTVAGDAPGADPLHLVLWERDGRPVRLQARRGEDEPVVYHFDERARLRYVRHPGGAYVLDEEARLLLLDADGAIRDDLTREERLARAGRLETDARQYLDEFVRED